MAKEGENVIDIKPYIKNSFLRGLYTLFSYPLESFFGIRGLNAAHIAMGKMSREVNFFERALLGLSGSYEFPPQELKKIPESGPLLVVANHPMGGIEGLVIGALLARVRPDVKLLANYLLGEMEGIRPYLIPVNPFGGNAAAAQNIAGIKESLRHLKNGGCLATFPSGTVSHFQFEQMAITDPEWNKHIAALARKTGASVLPIFFYGRNSIFFQIAGMINPKFRTLLLPRALVKQAKKQTVRMRIGTPISARKIEAFSGDEELCAWFRLNTYVLGRKKIEEQNSKSIFQFGHIKDFCGKLNKLNPLKRPMHQIIDPIPSEVLQGEIDALDASSILVDGESFAVYGADSHKIKNIMREIGRLREETFREVGEGTGKSADIDDYDEYYFQIFMWDKKNRKIVGGYRVGHVDRIMKSQGGRGLYATTLFKISPQLLNKIGGVSREAADGKEPKFALEMGRSFVASQYQRKSSTLAILWRGISEYLSRNPQYTILYGPVSITTSYNKLSKDLMVEFLSQHKTSIELSRYVKAKAPPKVKHLTPADKEGLDSVNGDVDKISALISEIEIDNKGIPVLLKHYLRLNGEILAFNVDKSFGNCIDGLIMVDMLKTDPKLLKNFFGVKNLVEYRRKHGLETPELLAELRAIEEKEAAQNSPSKEAKD